MKGFTTGAAFLVAMAAPAASSAIDPNLSPRAQCMARASDSEINPRDYKMARGCDRSCTKVGFNKVAKQCRDRVKDMDRKRRDSESRRVRKRCDDAMIASKTSPSASTYKACAEECASVDPLAADGCAQKGRVWERCGDAFARFRSSKDRQSASECQERCRDVVPDRYEVCKRRHDEHLRCDGAIATLGLGGERAPCEARCRSVGREGVCVPPTPLPPTPTNPCEQASLAALASPGDGELRMNCETLCGFSKAIALCPPPPPPPSSVPGYLGYSGAVVAVLGGAIWGLGEWDERYAVSGYGPGDENARLLESGERKRFVGQVTLVIGVSAVVGGVVWWLFDQPEETR